MKIEIINHSSDCIAENKIESICSKCTELLEKELKIITELVTVVFLSEEPMRALNFKFRKKNYATDVLSFESSEVNKLGELVFCVDKIELQAAKNQHSFYAEFAYLFIHGILHLLGYEHEENEEKAKIMFSIQDRLFAKLSLD